MRIVVLEELAADVALREQSTDAPDERAANRARPPDDWHILRVDPGAAEALDVGIGLKAGRRETRLTLLHLGPPGAERWMREELARGCDEAVRVWDEDAAAARTEAKALILAAAVRSCGFDLVLTGDTNPASRGGQLGVLLARRLGVPCVTRSSAAVEAAAAEDGQGSGPLRLRVTRELAGGYRELVEVALPGVVTVVPGQEVSQRVASVKALIEAQHADVQRWDLAALGVSRDAVRAADAPLRYGELGPLRPAHRFIPVPDSSAPAFDRILQLVAGIVQRREGRVVRGADDVVAEELFEALRREGWLDHLARGPRAPAGDSGSGPPAAT